MKKTDFGTKVTEMKNKITDTTILATKTNFNAKVTEIKHARYK